MYARADKKRTEKQVCICISSSIFQTETKTDGNRIAAENDRAASYDSGDEFREDVNNVNGKSID